MATPPGPEPLNGAIARAMAAMASGHHGEAAAALTAALALNPRHAQVHYMLGECAFALGDAARALDHVGRALGWERRKAAPFALAGRLLHLAGNSATGAALLERALALEPGHREAQLWLREARRRPKAVATHPAFEPLTRPLRWSLCMIVKDEAARLGRCLEAARRQVDEIAIVDTGSSDDTVTIARAYGARVAEAPWTNDFAAARNACLALATGDFALVLDADEVLEAATGRLRALADTLPIPALTGVAPLVRVTLHNHLHRVVSPDPWETQVVERAFWRTAMTFAGAAHEYPRLAPGVDAEPLVLAALDVAVHHFGYRPELMSGRDKLARNISLLEARAAATPDDAGVWYLLGRERVLAGRHAEGLEALRRYRALWPTEAASAITRMAAYMEAEAQSGLGRDDEALATLDAAIAFDPRYPSYHFLRGETLSVLGRYDEAAESYARAIANADYFAHAGLHPYNTFAPQHAGALAAERRARAARLARGEAAMAPAAGAAGLIGQALEALDEGALERAEAHLDAAAALAPGHSQVPYLRAELALRRDDVPGALAWAWASLRLDAAPAEPWALAGYLLHEDGDSALGRAFLERALARSPGAWAIGRLLRMVAAGPRDGFDHPDMAAWLAATPAP